MVRTFKRDISSIVNTDGYALKNLDFTESESAKVLSIKHVMLQAHRQDLYRVSDVVSSPEAVYKYLQLKFGNENREHFSLICLNSSNAIISHDILFSGTIDQAQVYPREILKTAILKNAASIILVHNHPSGNCKPSDDDIILTKRLKDVAREFGLRIHDHIIVSKKDCYSIEAARIITV